MILYELVAKVNSIIEVEIKDYYTKKVIKTIVDLHDIPVELRTKNVAYIDIEKEKMIVEV